MEIKVIYDEDIAICRKREVDAFNKKVGKPVKVLQYVVLGFRLSLFTFFALALAHIVNPIWILFMFVLTILCDCILLVVWHFVDERKKEYPSDVKYYLATREKKIKGHDITEGYQLNTRRGIIKYPPLLKVRVEGKNGKEKCASIPIVLCGYRKHPTEDVVDLTAHYSDSGEGRWYKGYRNGSNELCVSEEFND